LRDRLPPDKTPSTEPPFALRGTGPPNNLVLGCFFTKRGRMSSLRTVICLWIGGIGTVATAACGPVRRQQETRGSITGKIVTGRDSVPIAGAVVVIGGEGPAAGRAVVSGLSGFFQFDTVPAGEHFLIVTTPTLELAGLAVEKAGIVVRPGLMTHTVVRELSGPEIVQRLCSDDSRTSRAAVMGTIKPGARQRAQGVAVRILGRSTNDSVRTVDVTSDSAGHFIACGVARGSRVMVTASVDIFYAPMRVLPLMDSAFALYTATLEQTKPIALATEDTGAHFSRNLVSIDSTRDEAIVSGRVRTRDGKPVVGARVSLDSGTAVLAVSDASGRFTLRGVAPGVHTVVVKSVGYAPQYIGVDVGAKDEWNLSLVVSQTPVLEPVRVTAEQSELKRLGFYRRRETMNTGLFITADDLYWMNAKRITDIIPMVPALKVKRWSADDPDIIVPDAPKDMRRVICLAWYVDALPAFPKGAPSYTEWLNDVLPADSIAAVEVYPLHARKPFDLPFAARITECNLIVIWTKAHIARKEADRLKRSKR
jgi:hypothetical protein